MTPQKSAKIILGVLFGEGDLESLHWERKWCVQTAKHLECSPRCQDRHNVSLTIVSFTRKAGPARVWGGLHLFLTPQGLSGDQANFFSLRIKWEWWYHRCLCKIDCIVAVRHLSLQQGMKKVCSGASYQWLWSRNRFGLHPITCFDVKTVHSSFYSKRANGSHDQSTLQIYWWASR